MFETDTAEAETGRVVITDFTFKTANAAIKYIYGESLGHVSLEELFDVYKFVDKYDIEAARKKLGPTFEQEITTTNFCTIAKFAWMFANHILDRCAAFLAKHSFLTVTTSFVQLDQRLVMELLRKAAVVPPAVPNRTQYALIPSPKNNRGDRYYRLS
uniref:BTB domain-containing protein n=1 Tax=Panagrellus redivivus TaxID=6233 RepID=A0A7E4UNS7_PANRE